MPGLQVTTGAVAGPSAPNRAPASTYFAIGLTERGPTDKAVEVLSLADFVREFGPRTTFGALYDDIATFFQEGGTRAMLARVVGPAATTGALSAALQDGAVTPDDTLTVSAANAGAWSSRVSVQVLAGASAALFRLQVRFDGVVVEDYPNLSSPQDAISQVNATSRLIRLADAGSASTAPTNNPSPTGSPAALTAGTDDRASVTTTHYTAALALFGIDDGDGAVAIPGIGTAVHAALLAHATANNRLALLSHARNTDKTTLLATANALDNMRGGLFAPWIRIPDGSGGTRAISPEGYVAAVRARAHEAVGPWLAAAGENAKTRYVTAPDQVFTTADADDLDNGKVNIIRTIARSTRLYGWRSLSADQRNWKFLTGADVVNRVVTQVRERGELFVFGTIDDSGKLLSRMAGTLIGIVDPIAKAGGLFAIRDAKTGEVLSEPYVVETGPSINPLAVLADDRVNAQVSIRVAPTAARVDVQVTKAAVMAAL